MDEINTLSSLETDILNALNLNGEMRSCEIREELFPKYSKGFTSYSSKRSFDVVLSRALSGLESQGLVQNRKPKKTVSYYSITDEGRKRLVKQGTLEAIGTAETLGSYDIPKELITEILEGKAKSFFSSLFGFLKKLKMSKEFHFFLDEYAKEMVERRASEISITNYMHGLLALTTPSKKELRVLLEYLIDNAKPPFPFGSRLRDFIVVLEYRPEKKEWHDVSREYRERRIEKFVSWAKDFRNVDVDPTRLSSYEELFKEFTNLEKSYEEKIEKAFS